MLLINYFQDEFNELLQKTKTSTLTFFSFKKVVTYELQFKVFVDRSTQRNPNDTSLF